MFDSVTEPLEPAVGVGTAATAACAPRHDDGVELQEGALSPGRAVEDRNIGRIEDGDPIGLGRPGDVPGYTGGPGSRGTKTSCAAERARRRNGGTRGGAKHIQE